MNKEKLLNEVRNLKIETNTPKKSPEAVVLEWLTFIIGLVGLIIVLKR